MSELISRDALLDKIVNVPSKVTEKTFYDKQTDLLTGSAYRQNEIIDIINAMPTVEQKHGHWIWNPKKECFWCSICKAEESYNDLDSMPMYEGYPDFIQWNRFCRICRAKMDEVTEDE